MRNRGKKNDLGKGRYRGNKNNNQEEDMLHNIKKRKQVQKAQSGMKTLEYTRAEKEDKQQQVSFATQGSP